MFQIIRTTGDTARRNHHTTFLPRWISDIIHLSSPEVPEQQKLYSKIALSCSFLFFLGLKRYHAFPDSVMVSQEEEGLVLTSRVTSWSWMSNEVQMTLNPIGCPFCKYDSVSALRIWISNLCYKYYQKCTCLRLWHCLKRSGSIKSVTSFFFFAICDVQVK